MEDPRKKEPGDELTTREAAEERAKSEQPDDGVERGYFNEETNKQTVTLERAAADLAEMRQSEAEALEEAENEKIREEIDALRGDDKEPEAKPEAEAKEPEANEDGFDSELERALNNPLVADALAKQISENETARQTHVQALQQASIIAEQAFVSQFPEFAGATSEQCLHILANMAQQNPGRFAAFQVAAGNAKQLIAQHETLQKQSDEQQRQAFRSYADEQDRAFEKSNPFQDMPAATRHEVADAIIVGFKAYGIDAREYERLYQTDRTLRHAGFQRMMIDAAKYRMMQKSVKTVAAKPVPPVQRPGTRSVGFSDNRGSRSAADAFMKEPSLKNAAAALIARRASRS